MVGLGLGLEVELEVEGLTYELASGESEDATPGQSLFPGLGWVLSLESDLHVATTDAASPSV